MTDGIVSKSARDGRDVIWWGKLLVGIYLIALLVLALFAIIALWPRETDVTRTVIGLTIHGDSEASWMLLVFASGVLGGLIHAMRSFYWYVGHQKLVKSWVAMYLILPLLGGALSMVFYIMIRGGLLAGQLGGGSITDSMSPIGFTSVGVLVGLFSEQAILKLKDVADTLFSKPEPGDDSAPQERKSNPEPGSDSQPQ